MTNGDFVVPGTKATEMVSPCLTGFSSRCNIGHFWVWKGGGAYRHRKCE